MNQLALQGNVCNHPLFEDGTFIHTTPIVSCNENDQIITKHGSIYTLGQPDTKYEQEFPDAKRRLIEQIRKVTNEQ